ncbi:MAG: M20/M25/M40 family metallo-hydrolase [Eubacteriales bacterium]|nr:M20/M25/M40 family metallo-hydrolase [Eubacteriales bacterium]MDD3199874.1 M20/M25/M40 family metallo-hydrolase [Eubacteriales bacterium]MDD4630266.1 M20/M25/M40 family metallo-hydrolase [Eubacteriales bacterium]
MKQKISLILILSICITIFTGCIGTKELKPDDSAVQAAIIEEFQMISQIPRESGHEKEISTYLRSWAKQNGFEVIRDSANNVIINKPAASGYEKMPVTILQCNMDTAIAISDETVFDPVNDPVKIVQTEEALTGEGTSIGADSGIGMAVILYVLKNVNNHGPVRAIFTTDGENGMSGAEKLKEKHLEGNYLINMAWTNEKTIGMGSGGTASYNMMHDIEWTAPKNEIPYLISIRGLEGGDASKDLINGGANAIKIIGEILANAQGKGILFELASFNGGISGDTIPMAADALIIINKSDVNKMRAVINNARDSFRSAYGSVETNVIFDYLETDMPDKVVSFDDNGCIISFIYGIINGIQSMSESYDGIVESASNLGMVSTSTGDFLCQVSAFGTSDVGLYKVTSAHEAISSMSGFSYEYMEGIPRWPVDESSMLYGSISEIYNEKYGDKIKIDIEQGKHECGLFLEKNPRLQIVSIGTRIINSNNPKETLILDSVTKPTNILMAFLER